MNNKQTKRQHHTAGENLELDAPDATMVDRIPDPAAPPAASPDPEVRQKDPDTEISPASALPSFLSIASAAAPSPQDIAGLPTVMLLLPLADPPDIQMVRISAWHVDVQLRDADTRRAFMRLWAGLDQAGARLKDGRRVGSFADAAKWIFEQLEAIDRGQRPEIYDAKHNPHFSSPNFR